MPTEVIVTIVCSIIGSGAVFGFIQFLISRKDKKNDQFSELQTSIDSVKSDVGQVRSDVSELRDSVNSSIEGLKDDIARGAAIQARIRILRANDELRQDVHHSYEYFRQLHHDITDYEKYCEAHPDFKNNEAVNSIEYINRVYQDCLDKNNFLT